MGVLCCRRDWCTSKIDGIMRGENYVASIYPHLQTSVRKLKLCREWVFQMDNDTKHTSKVLAKWLKDNKVKVLEWPHNALTSIVWKICGQNWKSVCEQGGLQTWLSYTSSVRRNGPKFTQLIVGSLLKATQNVWPKLKNLKAMLPNTNWVYVNFWPIRNVMKEIKAEINHSLLLSWHSTFLK